MGVEEARELLAARGPLGQPAQLDPADRGMDIGHPVVESGDLVGVLRPIPWLRSSRTWRACSPLPQETMPPSPEVLFLVGYRENIPACPKVPTCWPSQVAP